MESDQKTYPAPWQGQLILACRKCQKKLKGDRALRPLAKLKKTVKRYNKEHPEQALHVINVPCMDLCPKDGVTVCNPARDSAGLSILRSEEDIEQLFHAF
jgi:predicted metal-binding protein